MAAEVETFRSLAYPWHCDTMGHMNTQFYCTMYDAASMHLLSILAPFVDIDKRGLGWADVRQVIEYKHEVRAGTLLHVRTRLLKLGGKSVSYFHSLLGSETGILHGTSEHVAVFFDLKARKAAPLEDAIHERAKAAGLI